MELELHPTERRDIVRHFNPAGRIWLRLVARFHEYATDLIPSQLNFSWITDSLAIGGSFKARQIRRLAAMGVGAVVDVREESRDDEQALLGHDIRLLPLPVADRYALSQEQLRRGAEWALQQMAQGRKVFVHCEHGVGRGPLAGAAVLVASGMSAPQALRLIRSKRWQASPNDRQLEALLAFEETWRAGLAPAESQSAPAG
jgi:hypothetical protein